MTKSFRVRFHRTRVVRDDDYPTYDLDCNVVGALETMHYVEDEVIPRDTMGSVDCDTFVVVVFHDGFRLTKAG